jgi:hypothetical protein
MCRRNTRYELAVSLHVGRCEGLHSCGGLSDFSAIVYDFLSLNAVMAHHASSLVSEDSRRCELPAVMFLDVQH